MAARAETASSPIPAAVTPGAALPPELKIEALSDQSIFVRAAISGVIREAVIAGALTGLLILLFLGSWRSTVIIAVSIPLSILVSICTLSALGQTITTSSEGSTSGETLHGLIEISATGVSKASGLERVATEALRR